MSYIQTDLDPILDAIHDNIMETQRRSEERHPEDFYTREMAEKDIAHWQAEARKGFTVLERDIEEAVSALPNWGGTRLTLVPTWDEREGPVFWLAEDEDPYVPIGGDLRFGPGTSAPGFTVFATKDGHVRSIDDVLDAGDTDFFRDPAVESDYFMLAEELRNPGGAKRIGNKVLTLYTARPAKDRRLYDNARKIPANVFLTTSEDEAYGYVEDLGGGRDVYRVRIKRMYLVETLNVGSKRNYQTFAGGDRMVPVESCDLVYADPGTKMARRVLARWRTGP